MPHRLIDERQALGDHRRIPQTSVLILEHDDGAAGIEPRRLAGVLQQKQCRQPHDLRFAWKEPQQKPRQPYGFLAQGSSDVSRTAARRIALVEMR